MKEQSEFDKETIRDFWLEEAKEALQVADHLVDKSDYSYSLCFGHLAIEKLLKAVYVTLRNEHPPHIHNLHRLASSADLEITEEQADLLDLITTFNIEARYRMKKELFARNVLWNTPRDR